MKKMLHMALFLAIAGYMLSLAPPVRQIARDDTFQHIGPYLLAQVIAPTAPDESILLPESEPEEAPTPQPEETSETEDVSEALPVEQDEILNLLIDYQSLPEEFKAPEARLRLLHQALLILLPTL